MVSWRGNSPDILGLDAKKSEFRLGEVKTMGQLGVRGQCLKLAFFRGKYPKVAYALAAVGGYGLRLRLEREPDSLQGRRNQVQRRRRDRREIASALNQRQARQAARRVAKDAVRKQRRTARRPTLEGSVRDGSDRKLYVEAHAGRTP